MGHLNPKLPYVPGFLVNFILKVASPVIFKLMKKVCLPPLPLSTPVVVGQAFLVL